MFWLKTLVAVHVLSAIVGIGPTFIMHLLLRGNQSAAQLRQSLDLMGIVERFPKIGGPVAVLSGILLVSLYGYGSFGQLWLVGSLVLFVLVQIVVVGVAGRQLKPVLNWKRDASEQQEPVVPLQVEAALRRVGGSMWLAHGLAVALFLLMIVKPTTMLW
ncbi:DUF2269 family protein [Paenibacillus sp.]|uniref:DUF2269 family protein n=1 Tax=Paenibacillus sp. TaxID=58172 RepID=UPI00281169FE|nr:DUF2269 family protein [Paenibacillus sp.]